PYQTSSRGAVSISRTGRVIVGWRHCSRRCAMFPHGRAPVSRIGHAPNAALTSGCGVSLVDSYRGEGSVGYSRLFECLASVAPRDGAAFANSELPVTVHGVIRVPPLARHS